MVLQALTGVASFVGVPAVDAMKILVEELNAKKFLGADRLVIEVADSASARPQAVAAVTRAAANPEILAIMGPTAAVEGIVFNSDWMPGGNNADGRAFAAAYKKATGKDADALAAAGYSHLLALATAIKNASPNPTREKIRDALTRTKDVPVVVGAGRYSFKDDRIPVYGSIFLQVRNGQFVAAP